MLSAVGSVVRPHGAGGHPARLAASAGGNNASVVAGKSFGHTTGQPGAPRRCLEPCASAKRTPKDPKAFDSMDDARAALMGNDAAGGGFIAGTLNWLSEGAFGRMSDGPAWLYRKVLDSPWARGLKSDLSTRPGYIPSELDDVINSFILRGDQPVKQGPPTPDDLDPSKREVLMQLTTLLDASTTSVMRLYGRYPPLLDMEPMDVFSRIVAIKSLLPNCDVLMMLDQVPMCFMSGTQEELSEQVGSSVEILTAGLPGADLDTMLEENPGLLFEDAEVLRSGIAEMHDLWELDETSIAMSEPHHLALAIKALSVSGAPKRWGGSVSSGFR